MIASVGIYSCLSKNCNFLPPLFVLDSWYSANKVTSLCMFCLVLLVFVCVLFSDLFNLNILLLQLVSVLLPLR